MQLGINPPAGEVRAGRASVSTGKPRGKIGRRARQHLMQTSARFFLGLRLGRDPWQGKPGGMREALDRVGERKPLGLHHKIENIAVFTGGKVEPGHFLVVHKEGRRFFRVEWRKPFPFAPGPHQFDAPAHDLRDRKPGFDLIEKGWRKSHGGAQG